MNTLKIIVLAVAILAAAYFGGCSYENVSAIKQHASETWAASGFEIIGYEGYEIGGFLCGTPGGKVWYIVQRKGDAKTRYDGFITKWGDEYHIYNLKAIDALTR
jgi:hypothetical protein